ncbi:MAG TPA: hypothetical protein PJ986_07650 [Gammaproteobacteria bacterium]|nr:hypothetical protein [Gammaproteobacteria bacterium]
MNAMRSLVAVLAVALVGCAAPRGEEDGPVSRLDGNYKAGAPNYTIDGRPTICDTAGSPGRSVTRCY